MNTNPITNLSPPPTLSSAATKKYIDDSSSPENIVAKISGAYRETVILDSSKKLKVNTSDYFTVDEYGVIFVDPQFLIKRDDVLKPNGSIMLDANKKLAVNFNPNEFYLILCVQFPMNWTTLSKFRDKFIRIDVVEMAPPDMCASKNAKFKML